jgi:hypothetical protein
MRRWPRPGATALRSAAGQEGRHDLTTQTPVLPTTGWSRLAGHPGRVTSCSTRSQSRSSASSAPALRRCIRRSQVARVVESDAFADAWVQANRVAHAELVAALTGEGGGSLTVENDTVSVNLAAFIETVKQRLVESGFTVANKRALGIGAVALTALALVFWGRPTGKVVIGLTIALLVVLAIIEFLGRSAPPVGGRLVREETS